MKNKKTIKHILIGLLIAIALLVGYSIVAGGGSETTGTSSLSSLIGSDSFGQVQESNTNLANTEILRILGSIQNISLDDDIFNDPVFRELEDSRFTIPRPVRIGRPNPFLPIGFDALTITTNTVTTSTEQNTSTGFFQN